MIEDRFEKGIGTISYFIHHVANVFKPFADGILVPKADQYNKVHKKLREYAPYFDGCYGAFDGTHIPVTVDSSVKEDYMNRHGFTSMNVCAVVDMSKRFTFVGVGKVGSVHDMAVLNECQEAPNFTHPLAGAYCIFYFNLYQFKQLVHLK